MWVRSPDYGNTLGASRKKRRDELVDGLGAALEQTGGGFDALARAERAAMQDKERKDATAYEREQDALARAERAAADTYRREQDALNRKERSERDAYQREQDALERARADAERVRIEEETRKKRESDEGAKALDGSRALLKRVVAAGIEQGMTAEEIAAQAREMPGLEALTGDEEVVAEYRTQRQPERDRIAKVQEQMAIDEARAKADMERDAARAKLRPQGGGARPQVGGGGPKMPSDVRARGKARMIEMADANIQAVEDNLRKFDEATLLPATGRYTGAIRGLFTGWVPGFNENERAAFNGAAESYNAMVFNILGREDAPAESENKRLAHLFISENNTPDELRAKIDEAKRQIAEQRSILGQTTDVVMPGAQLSAEQIADQVLEEMPDASDEEIAAEVERRMRGG